MPGENLTKKFFWKIRPMFLPSGAHNKKVLFACFQKNVKKKSKNKEKMEKKRKKNSILKITFAILM